MVTKLQWKRTFDKEDGDGLAIRYAYHLVALAVKRPKLEPPRSKKVRQTTEQLSAGAGKGH